MASRCAQECQVARRSANGHCGLQSSVHVQRCFLCDANALDLNDWVIVVIELVHVLAFVKRHTTLPQDFQKGGRGSLGAR
jgi:hypothetical protein